MDGHYVTINELGKKPCEIPPVVTYYKSVISKSYHAINAVTWFTLKKYGINIYGEPVKNLILNISEYELHTYLTENVNSYWTNWLTWTKNYFH